MLEVAEAVEGVTAQLLDVVVVQDQCHQVGHSSKRSRRELPNFVEAKIPDVKKVFKHNKKKQFQERTRTIT